MEYLTAKVKLFKHNNKAAVHMRVTASELLAFFIQVNMNAKSAQIRHNSQQPRSSSDFFLSTL